MVPPRPGSYQYSYEKQIGSHAQVLKDLIFCSLLQELQKLHPERGVCVVHAHAGEGVYDLAESTADYQAGLARVVAQVYGTQPYKVPVPVKEYVRTVMAAAARIPGAGGTTATAAGTTPPLACYPAAPLLAQQLLRPPLDEHRLCDAVVPEVEGLDLKRAQFQPFNCYDPATLDFLLPVPSQKHTLIMLDPPFDQDYHWSQTKQLVERLLERDPTATVLVAAPYIHGSRYRWGYAGGVLESMAERARVGRYRATLTVQNIALQGSAVLVANPPPNLDEVVGEPVLSWLATTMNQGKDEFSVEQVMTKKKIKAPVDEATAATTATPAFVTA